MPRHRPQSRPTSPKPKLHQRLLPPPAQPQSSPQKSRKHTNRHNTAKRDIMHQGLIVLTRPRSKDNPRTPTSKNTSPRSSALMLRIRPLSQKKSTHGTQQSQDQYRYLRPVNTKPTREPIHPKYSQKFTRSTKRILQSLPHP